MSGDHQPTPTERDPWTAYTFGLANPQGPGQGDVAALLRRVADSIDDLGDIEVMDVTFASEGTADEPRVMMTVYYLRP